MQWYLTVVLVCISLITYDVRHLYTHLLVIYVSFAGGGVKVLGPFFNLVFHFLMVEFQEFFVYLDPREASKTNKQKKFFAYFGK